MRQELDCSTASLAGAREAHAAAAGELKPAATIGASG